MKAAADIEVTEIKPVHSSQQAFLANGNNKSQFIALLSKHLVDDGHTVRQAVGDADTDIVQAALEVAALKQVVTVVADDTDVLVLLVYHFQPSMADIYMSSPSKQQGSNWTGSKLVSIRNVQKNIGCTAVKELLVVHALTGCDTTSALFGIGKPTAFKKVTGYKAALPLAEVISSYSSTQDEVAYAGCQLLVMLYGGKSHDTLNSLRFTTYMSLCATSISKPVPEKLPPTERAAYYHCLRTHLQVVQWKSLMTQNINAIDWGWVLEEGKLKPLSTDLEPAPADLLKVIRCGCKSSSKNPCSTNLCTCRRNGLHCVSACGDCHGDVCMNAEQVITTYESETCETDDGDDPESSVNLYFDDNDLVWQNEEEVEMVEACQGP
jgi:hypothetical protein